MTETHTLLVVDPDELLVEMIESGFRLDAGRFEVVKAAEPAAALALLKRTHVDAIVTELEFPQATKTGVEFLLDLEDWAPQLPVIVLTEGPTIEVQGMFKAAAFLSKPPDMDHLLRKVERAVHQSKESILRGISLETFLQILQVERKTCTLTVNAGRHVGRLYVHDGELIHAETDSLQSKAAAFAMLSWADYTIKVSEVCQARPTITERLNAILMEWCVQKDHGLL